MNKKVLMGAGGGVGVVGAILVALWTILAGGGIQFAYTYNYDGDESDLNAALLMYPEDSIVAVKCTADNVTIHNGQISLMGEADFDGMTGDILYLHKTDGIWTEMTGRVFADREG